MIRALGWLAPVVTSLLLSGAAAAQQESQEQASQEIEGTQEEQASQEVEGTQEEQASQEVEGTQEEQTSQEVEGTQEEQTSQEVGGTQEEQTSQEVEGDQEEQTSQEVEGDQEDTKPAFLPDEEIEIGRPPAESWLEILEMQMRLGWIGEAWQKTRWLNDTQRFRTRRAARRMAKLSKEIELNVDLDKIERIKVHRAGKQLRWRLGLVLAEMGLHGTPLLPDLLRAVNSDLYVFYDHLPGVLGPRNLPPLGGPKPPEAADLPDEPQAPESPPAN